MKTKVLLKKGEGRTINAGGLWIYDNEIKEIHGHFKNGDIVDVLKDNAERTKDATKETLRHAVIEDGWQIFNRKGNTCYGIAAATTAIVKSILFNENRIYPVSVHLDGQYGMNDIFLSDEQKALEESYKVLKDFCQQLD